MKNYHYFRLTVASSTPLPGLRPGPKSPPDCTLLLEPAQPIATQYDWFHHWTEPSGDLYLSCARTSRGLRLRFPARADFLITHDGREVICYPHAGVSMDSVRHRLMHQVLPRVLSYRGALVLHASVVQVREGAIAFLGDSGWGKSTMAASLVAAGGELLSDDCLVMEQTLDQVYALNGFPTLRLWSDSADLMMKQSSASVAGGQSSTKQQLLLKDASSASSSDRQPLAQLFVLDPSAQQNISITPMSRRDALMALTKHSFRLDMANMARSAEILTRLVKVVETAPVFQLGYPRDYAILPAVHAAIRDNLVGVTHYEEPVQDKYGAGA